MTILHERIVPNHNGHAIKRRKPVEVVKEPVPALVSYARMIALGIAVMIGGTSFVLSFATLCDLANRAGYGSRLAWMWPLSVDGAIILATVAIVALTAFEGHVSSRRFFWQMLLASAAVSVTGNILHPFILHSFPTILAAVVDCIPPLSLLAATHGLAILLRFNPNRED